jgi:hypothetical protein
MPPTGMQSPAVSTKPQRRTLSQADQRELLRLLRAILDRVYDGTLDPAGAMGIARRIEGARTILEATLSPAAAIKSARQAR